MTFSRREFGRRAFGIVPAALVGGRRPSAAAAAQAKPDSLVAGVQIGLNVPFNFGSNTMSADEVLARCLRLGVSAVELRAQPVEAFLGVSPALVAAAAGRSGRGPRTTAEVAAEEEAAATLRQWRIGVPMRRVRAFRRRFEEAGVRIEIVKFDGIYRRADDELDYCFELARNLGARAISCEIDGAETKRLGQVADRHRLMVGYHGHAETTPAHWIEAFGQARYNGANVDIGHFVAGNNLSPIPFLIDHHERVTHIHIKDRRRKNGPNVPFGHGDTPIVETLRLIRDRRWPIQATIEFEYPIPPESDRMVEIAKCIEYCRRALS